MDNKEFFSKLWDQFASVIIGVLIGLPAVGIIIPQLFAMLSDAPDHEVDAVFKVFGMLYFAMPLILLFAWSFFQFNNSLFRGMRKLTWIGVASMATIFLLLLLSMKVSQNDQQLIFYLLFFVIIGTLRIYWSFFLAAEKKLLERIEQILTKLREVNQDNYKWQWGAKHAEQKILVFEDKRTKALASLKLMISFLFLATHLSVISLLAIFDHIFDHNIYMILTVALYIPVFRHCLLNTKIKELRAKSMLSDLSLIRPMLFLIIIISLVFFIAASPGADSKSSDNKLSFEGLSSLSKMNRQIATLDSDFREKAIVRDSQMENLLPYRYLHKLFQSRAINVDSFSTFNNRLKRCGIADGFNGNNYNLYTMSNRVKKDKSKIGFLAILSDLTKLEQKNEPPIDQNSLEKIQRAYRSSATIQSFWRLQSRDSANWIAGQIVNREVRAIKARRMVAEKDRIKVRELLVIKKAQHTGIVIFVTTLIVALAFLMILSYSDDLFHRETLADITSVRKSLQIICLIIVILLIPLLKAIPESDIDPAKPGSLFLLSNWNLTEAFKEPEKPAIKAPASHSPLIPPSESIPYTPTDSPEYPINSPKCGACCLNISNIKFPDFKDTIVSRYMIEWINIQQNQRQKRDSLFLILLNKLTVNQKPIDFTEVEKSFTQIIQILNDSKTYHRQTKEDADTVIKRLDSILRQLEYSQYKTKFNSQLKP